MPANEMFNSDIDNTNILSLFCFRISYCLIQFLIQVSDAQTRTRKIFLFKTRAKTRIIL